MRHLPYFTLIALLLFCRCVNAELTLKDDIRYWQLFDSQGLTLQEVVGTPNNGWEKIPEGQTQLNVLDKEYWQTGSGANLWVKIELPRIIDSERVWIELAPNVGLNGKMAIYENGIWTWKLPAGRAGSDHSSFPATFLTFTVDQPREHRLIFLKVNSSQILNFSINIRSHDTQLSLLASRNLIYGIVLGLMILAAIYNMAIGISAGERTYIYYATYVISMILYIIAITGYNRLAFPEWGGDGSFTNMAVCLVMFSATVFVQQFLQTRTTIPKLDILLRLQSSALFVTIFLLGFISDSLSFILVETIGLIIPFVLLACALGALKAKHPMAKFFLLAWITHLATGSMWGWMWLGYAPATLDSLNLFIAGSITEHIILSVLLGYSYVNLKRKSLSCEDDQSQAKINTDQDLLTGIYNRQGLYKQIERAMKNNEPDLIWIDINIDDFAEFNARHGVHLGDVILSEFGQLLQSKVRRDNLAAKLIDKETNVAYRRGLVGRVSGGQFTIVLSNCTLPQARLYIERLARDFENIKVKSSEGKWVNNTICASVVAILPNDSFQSAWQRASKKLYSAKTKGRAQIAFS
jgi:diguanylate cyclase (GGDEF)-like protein